MKIGILSPNSGFYPYIGIDLFQSIKHFLGTDHQYVVKDTHLATPKENQQALKELILFENVDMVVGFVGYKSLTAIKPLIQQTKTPMIICNSGDHPLLKADVSPYIVHCSLDMFNSIYFACKWAFKNIGEHYSRLSSFFEAGFPLAMATETAARQYSGKVNITETSHRNKADQLEEHIANVQKENNDFVFMGYHGFEAIEVLQNLANAKVLKGIPLICSPFLTQPEVIQPNVANPIYSVKTWEDNTIHEQLNTFFNSELRRDLSLSGILGYEVAMIIKYCIAKEWDYNDEITPLLSDLEIESPRGHLQFNSELNNFNYYYYLFELKKSEDGDGIINKQIDTIVPDKSDWEILNNFKEEMSGWQNTYLCN